MKRHSLMMLGCIVPLLAIAFVPAIGKSAIAPFLIAVPMLVCCLGMMGGHGHGENKKKDGGKESRNCH
ncbi:MAG: hypothetical protein PW734_11205 [Verrucomicrobium sp.]|nr:hypothetical protein [Verrucomicrobium sp.]